MVGLTALEAFNRFEHWASVTWMPVRLELLCQPPATAIDLTFYDRRRRRTQRGGHVTVRIHRLNGVGLVDVVAALEGELPEHSFVILRVSFVEPPALLYLFGASQRVLHRHVELTDRHSSCSVAMRDLMSQLGALQTLVERL